MKATLYKIRHIRTGVLMNVVDENSRTLTCYITHVPEGVNEPILKVGLRNKIGAKSIGILYEKIED